MPTALFCLGLVLSAVPAAADSGGAGDADAVRKAVDSFDAGGNAYREGRYELAASHFEQADEAVPSARAVRMAMRARLEAKHYARALTHAAQALARYPDDAETNKLATEALAKHRSKLHRVEVSCNSECVVAVGTRIVPGLPRTSWVVYVDPGSVTLGASFVDGTGADKQEIEARAGGKNAISFMPSREAAKPTPKPAGGDAGAADGPDGPKAGGSDAAGSGSATRGGADGGGPAAGGSAAGAGASGGADGDGGGSFITSPGVFIGLAVVTAGLGGVTIWSGLDTINNPGADTVREVCRGIGPECPEYQQGRDAQLRTNILIGATAGVGALTTAFAIFVTDWGGGDDEAAAKAARAPLQLAPVWSVTPTGGFAGMSGRF